MATRRGRPLSRDERRLWAEVARAVVPLAGRALPPEEQPAAPPQAPPKAPQSPRPLSSEPKAVPRPSGLAPLAPLERRTMRALSRGQAAVDGVLDLHGMRQADAHGALRAFLLRSQSSGRSVVLVVTGKGAPGIAPDISGEERGVLRRMVPHWLRLPDLRPLVVGFDTASARHGGTGALYVRLRRRRSG